MTNVHWKHIYQNSLGDAYTSISAVSWHVRANAHVWSPPTDLYETDNTYIVRVEIGGMHKNAFDIIIEDGFLIIKGKRPEPVEKKAFHQMEVRFGEFSSIVEIPSQIDESRAQAEYKDGFLIITIPKYTITE